MRKWRLRQGNWLDQGHTAGELSGTAGLATRRPWLWGSLLTLGCDDEASWDTIPGTGVVLCSLGRGVQEGVGMTGQSLGLGHQPSVRATVSRDVAPLSGHRNPARGGDSGLLFPPFSPCPHFWPKSRAIWEALALVDGG